MPDESAGNAVGAEHGTAAASMQVVVLVGTNKGAFAFMSDENRREWRRSGPFLEGWEIFSILGDSRGAPRLFAGTSHMAYGATIRVSDDIGETWRQIEHGPRFSKESGFQLRRIWQIVPGAPSEADTLYAGTDEAALFVTRDRGESWTELPGLTDHPSRPAWRPGCGGLCVHSILVDPTDPRRLWVGISAVGVFYSPDGGGSWESRSGGLPRSREEEHPDAGFGVTRLAADPFNPDTLYAQTHGGVYKSSDGGREWVSVNAGLPTDFGFPICTDSSGNVYVVPLVSESERYFPGGQMRVYTSGDGGCSWRALSRGLPGDPQYVSVLRDCLTADALTPAGIYLGTTSGELFYSADSGENWQRLPGQFSRVTSVRAWTIAS